MTDQLENACTLEVRFSRIRSLIPFTAAQIIGLGIIYVVLNNEFSILLVIGVAGGLCAYLPGTVISVFKLINPKYLTAHPDGNVTWTPLFKERRFYYGPNIRWVFHPDKIQILGDPRDGAPEFFDLSPNLKISSRS